MIAHLYGIFINSVNDLNNMFQDILFGILISLYLGAFIGSVYHWIKFLISPKKNWLLPQMSTCSLDNSLTACNPTIPTSPIAGLLVVYTLTITLIQVVKLNLTGEEINVGKESVSLQAITMLNGWFIILFLHILWIDYSFNWKQNFKVIRPYFLVLNHEMILCHFARAFSLFCFSILPVFMLMILTIELRDKSKLNPLLKLINQETDWSTIGWLYLSAVIAAPLAEEIMFRFCLQGLLLRFIKPIFAVFLTAILFSGAHGWPDALPLMPLALILGYHMYHTGEYITVVFTHAIFNCFMLTNFIIVTYMEG